MAAASVKKNYIYNLLQRLLTLITPLITIPYISRVIGAEGIGIYSYTNSIVSYFALFAALGTITYGQREISYTQDDFEKRTQVFWNTEIRCIITTSICLGAYGIFVFFQNQNRLIYLIQTIAIIEVILDVTWLFMGMEMFETIVRRNIVVRILNVFFIFLFVKEVDDLPIYVLGVTFVTAAGYLSLWPLLPKLIGLPKIKELHPFKDFRIVLSLFVPTIAISIYTVLDKTMIGVLTQDAFENGYYDQSVKIVRISMTFVTALGAVMVPRIGHLFAKKEIEQIKQYMYRSYRFACFLGIPLCLGIIGISSVFVPCFFGNGFAKVIPIVEILSLIIIAIAISNVTGIQFLVPTKRQNLLTLSVIIGAITNFFFNLITIPLYGAIGAALASVIAEFTVMATQLLIVRKEISCYKILKNSINYIIAGLLMLTVLLFLGKNAKPAISSTILFITIGCILYPMILYVLHDDFFLTNLDTIKNKIKQKLSKNI